jgi:hypothetical protein
MPLGAAITGFGGTESTPQPPPRLAMPQGIPSAKYRPFMRILLRFKKSPQWIILFSTYQ